MKDILKNKLDAPIAIMAWVLYLVTVVCPKLIQWLLDKLPIFGKYLVRKHLDISDIQMFFLALALSLTLGLLANLRWVVTHLEKAGFDSHKAAPPGELNWLVAAGSMIVLLLLRAGWNSVKEFLYWASGWEIARAILAIILVSIVAVVALVMRRHGLGGRHRRRRR